MNETSEQPKEGPLKRIRKFLSREIKQKSEATTDKAQDALQASSSETNAEAPGISPSLEQSGHVNNPQQVAHKQAGKGYNIERDLVKTAALRERAKRDLQIQEFPEEEVERVGNKPFVLSNNATGESMSFMGGNGSSERPLEIRDIVKKEVIKKFLTGLSKDRRSDIYFKYNKKVIMINPRGETKSNQEDQ